MIIHDLKIHWDQAVRHSLVGIDQATHLPVAVVPISHQAVFHQVVHPPHHHHTTTIHHLSQLEVYHQRVHHILDKLIAMDIQQQVHQQV